MSALASLPDSTPVYVEGHGVSTLGAIRGERVRFITTDEASRLYSYAPETWARWAPTIPGAFKDRWWRLPLAGCEAHVAALAEPKPRKRRGYPWKAKTAHTVGVRPTHLQVG